MSDSSPRPVLLQARSLRFSRNGQRIFGPLDLSLAAGELLLLRGANGAGKTTLLRVLAGLLRADAGTLEVAAGPAWLGHLPALNADLDARANLDYLCGLHGRRDSVGLDEALAVTGLHGHERTPVRQLSAGQRKRLSLARLWASPAALWLLDEPYANLDLDGIDLLDRMLAAHLQDGGAAVASLHGMHAGPALPTRQLHLDAAA